MTKDQQDSKVRAEILAKVGGLYDLLPEGEVQAKAAVLCGAVLEASGLKGGEEWCTLARLVSDAHGGKPAAVVVSIPGKDDDDEERQVLSFSSDSTVGAVPAKVAEWFVPPTKH